MNLNDIKSAIAKERHAELMIGTGGAFLIAWMASILDPETLKLLEAPGPIPGFRLAVWGICVIAGIYLVIKGLNRIDAERAASKTQGDASMPIAAPSGATNPLTIQITHGNTHISIHIQPEKNDAL